MYATPRNVLLQRTSRIPALGCRRILRSASDGVLAGFQKVPATTRTVAARVARCFATFAHVPYETAVVQQEFELMDNYDTTALIDGVGFLFHGTATGKRIAGRPKVRGTFT
jgi:hypothetical protein